jgi:hypothetical protein
LGAFPSWRRVDCCFGGSATVAASALSRDIRGRGGGVVSGAAATGCEGEEKSDPLRFDGIGGELSTFAAGRSSSSETTPIHGESIHAEEIMPPPTASTSSENSRNSCCNSLLPGEREDSAAPWGLERPALRDCTSCKEGK